MDPIAPAPPPLQDDEDVMLDDDSTFLADELGSFFKLLLDSIFLLDDETFTLELEFIVPLLDEDETFLFDELDLGVTLEDKDRATLDDDSSEGSVAEQQSSPHAARKKTT